MKIHQGYDNLNIVNPVVTLGIFDGVHRGHRSLIDKLILRAKELKGEATVITFYPHPRLVLGNDKLNLSFLSTMEEKLDLLAAANVDHLIILKFNREFSKIRACDFVKDILIEKIRTKLLLIGYNHHFGRRGEGDFNTIKQCTELSDFKVEQVQGIQAAAGSISSSVVREALLKGRIDEANDLLGYFYTLSGTVISGNHIGTSFGFPTANIIPGDKYKLIPANGVYAVKVQIDEISYNGMLSIGSNPTVNPDNRKISIEVHILDFSMNIYGKSITIGFRKRLRDEKKFDNTDQLALQMELDKLDTIRILS